MENSLIGAGVACIIAAIVGGGLKAFGMEIPLLNSIKRQFLLGLFGLALFASPFVLMDNEPDSKKNDCIPPYTWRLAVPSDHVCVSEDSRKLVELENARAPERRQVDGIGPYGADTCLNGYVWREAFKGDTYCVLPERRAEVQDENEHALERANR